MAGMNALKKALNGIGRSEKEDDVRETAQVQVRTEGESSVLE
jgi:hypothetical protein